jgi:hypothetical protein
MTQLFRAPSEKGIEGTFSKLDVTPKQQIVKNGHMEEKSQILKGSGNAPFGYGIRGEL